MTRTTLLLPLLPLLPLGCSEKDGETIAIVHYDDTGEGDTDTDTDTDADADADTDSEFEDVYIEALAACSGCHIDTGGAAGLDLSPEGAYAALMSRDELVVAGDPDGSYLVQKMRGDAGISGDPMPPTSGSSEAQITIVSDWISAGANP